VLDLNDFFYFVQVVDRGGEAERTLRLPKSTLSRPIQQPEAELGVRLLNRPSRGTVWFTTGVATARFAMRDMLADFFVRFPR